MKKVFIFIAYFLLTFTNKFDKIFIVRTVIIMKFGYVRVSSKQQNEGRQIETLKNYVDSDENIIIEKASGKDFDRAEYQILKHKTLRAGDELFVQSLDRFGRNKSQIKSELEELKSKGIKVRILDIPTTLTDYPESWISEMVNNIVVEVLGAMAEQERQNIRQRQAEGIALWRKTGKTKSGRPYGRKPIEKPKNWDKIYTLWKNKEMTAVTAMRALGLKKNSFYKLAKTESMTPYST